MQSSALNIIAVKQALCFYSNFEAGSTGKNYEVGV